MRKFSVLLLVLLITFPINGIDAQTKSKRVKTSTAATATPRYGNTDGITAEQMKNYLTFIASDELEGRSTPSRGLDIAAMYIASYLKFWDIKPAGDNGTYYQRFPLSYRKIDPQNTKLELNGEIFKYGEDFLSSYIGGNLSGTLVYAGNNGWLIKSKGIDAYRGVDVKDKIAIVFNGYPKRITFNDLNGKQGDDWVSPVLYAQMKGARAVIVIANYTNQTFWRNSIKEQTESGSLEFSQSPEQISIPVITASPSLIYALFQDEKINGISIYNKAVTGDTFDAFELSATKKVNLNITVKTETLHTQNVVGILEGSDSVLKNEYIAIGAHYDHKGMSKEIPGEDKIMNGADDDGSGTVAVMALAEAFSKGQRPKRSIIFIWHAGEEKGLWGSAYFTDNPTVPINSIITQLNIDMIGRAQQPGDENPTNQQLPKQGEVFVIGSKLMSTELGELSESVNKSFLNLSFNYKYDDPNDKSRFFYRSDHYSYARKGIPIIFYMDGSHADYHQPSDSIEKIDFAQMEKITRTIFATGWELANRPTRPRVDKPLPTK